MIDVGLALTNEERSFPRDALGWYKKYGVSFADPNGWDIDALREWRNHPDIRRFMVFRGEITPEMQWKWYTSLDPAKERYSVLYHRGERIGITQLLHIDEAARTGEGGITLWRPEHQNGLLSYRVAIAGMDWDFLQRGLVRLDVTVLKSNQRARRFVRSLGYRLHDPDPSGEILRGSVHPEAYFLAVRPWRELIHQEMRAQAEPYPIGA